jgi:Icc-related predicted phosphoesterase
MEKVLSFRILATSDTHFDLDATELENLSMRRGQLAPWFREADCFVHAGDLMYYGTEGEWAGRIKFLQSIPEQCGKERIYVPGNHDIFVELFTGPANQDLQRKAKFKMLGTHPKYFVREIPDGPTILGLPFVTDLPGWAFNRTEETLYRMVEALHETHKKIDVIVTHSPPLGILDGSHYGAKAWLYLQHAFKPTAWICGHVHENYGTHCHNGTTFYNVSMLDRNYKVRNRPVLIEV